MKNLFRINFFLLVNLIIINAQSNDLVWQNSFKNILGTWSVEKTIIGRITGITKDSAQVLLKDSVVITDTVVYFFNEECSIKECNIFHQDASDFFYQGYGELYPPEPSLKNKVIEIFEIDGYDKKMKGDSGVYIIKIDNEKIMFPFMGYYFILTKSIK